MHKSSFISCNLDPKQIRKALPDSPGVYLFRDSSGRVIYVGKAKDLKKRVSSYFKAKDTLTHKTRLMMKRADKLDFIMTSTENEAFILESNLIRVHMPRYNIILRDDKRYPSLRLDPNEQYPRLSIVRKIKKDGAWYFGPFSSANSVHNTLRVIDRVFLLRKCKGRKLPKRSRPCLNHQMGLCLGPCANDLPPSVYRGIVDQVRLFLEGRNRELIHKMGREMAEASERLDFENAAKIRDQIEAIKKTIERQHVVSPKMEDLDAVGIVHGKEISHVVVLLIRGGAVLGSRNFTLKNYGWPGTEIMEAFLKQYYSREDFIPGQILISEKIPEVFPMKTWLSDMAQKSVSMICPQRGKKFRLIRMAVENAENLMAGSTATEGEDLIPDMQAALNLKSPPRYIEGLDISNLQGEMAVGSVVSFVEGLPNRTGYRNYRINAVDGIDDYGMMSELISRRIRKGPLPDLFVIDGGKGHLSAVKRVLDLVVEEPMPEVISIAKPDRHSGERYEKIYIPGRKNALSLRPDNPVFKALIQVRDEAHRRAVSYHRSLRTKKLKQSKLDLIPGVGKRRKAILINNYSNIDSISKAGIDDLAGIPGIGEAVAKEIVEFFNREKPDNKKNNNL